MQLSLSSLYLFFVSGNIAHKIILVKNGSVGLRPQALNVHYVTDSLYRSHTTHTLISHNTTLLSLSSFVLIMYGKGAIPHAGLSAWNTLTEEDIRAELASANFRKLLKIHYRSWSFAHCQVFTCTQLQN